MDKKLFEFCSPVFMPVALNSLRNYVFSYIPHNFYVKITCRGTSYCGVNPKCLVRTSRRTRAETVVELNDLLTRGEKSVIKVAYKRTL